MPTTTPPTGSRMHSLSEKLNRIRQQRKALDELTNKQLPVVSRATPGDGVGGWSLERLAASGVRDTNEATGASGYLSRSPMVKNTGSRLSRGWTDTMRTKEQDDRVQQSISFENDDEPEMGLRCSRVRLDTLEDGGSCEVTARRRQKEAGKITSDANLSGADEDLDDRQQQGDGELRSTYPAKRGGEREWADWSLPQLPTVAATVAKKSQSRRSLGDSWQRESRGADVPRRIEEVSPLVEDEEPDRNLREVPMDLGEEYGNDREYYGEDRMSYDDPYGGRSYRSEGESSDGVGEKGLYYGEVQEISDEDEEEEGYGEGNRGYREEEEGYGEGSRGYREEEEGYGEGNRGYREEEEGYGEGNRGYREEEEGYGEGNRGYREEEEGYGEGNRGYREEEEGYGEGNRGYREEEEGYGEGSRGYREEEEGYGEGNRGYREEEEGYGEGNRGYREEEGYGEGSRGYREEEGYGEGNRGYREEEGYGEGSRGYREEEEGYGEGSRGYREEEGYGEGSRGYREEEEGYGEGSRGYREEGRNSYSREESWVEAQGSIYYDDDRSRAIEGFKSRQKSNERSSSVEYSGQEYYSCIDGAGEYNTEAENYVDSGGGGLHNDEDKSRYDDTRGTSTYHGGSYEIEGRRSSSHTEDEYVEPGGREGHRELVAHHHHLRYSSFERAAPYEYDRDERKWSQSHEEGGGLRRSFDSGSRHTFVEERGQRRGPNAEPLASTVNRWASSKSEEYFEEFGDAADVSARETPYHYGDTGSFNVPRQSIPVKDDNADEVDGEFGGAIVNQSITGWHLRDSFDPRSQSPALREATELPEIKRQASPRADFNSSSSYEICNEVILTRREQSDIREFIAKEMSREETDAKLRLAESRRLRGLVLEALGASANSTAEGQETAAGVDARPSTSPPEARFTAEEGGPEMVGGDAEDNVGRRTKGGVLVELDADIVGFGTPKANKGIREDRQDQRAIDGPRRIRPNSAATVSSPLRMSPPRHPGTPKQVEHKDSWLLPRGLGRRPSSASSGSRTPLSRDASLTLRTTNLGNNRKLVSNAVSWTLLGGEVNKKTRELALKAATSSFKKLIVLFKDGVTGRQDYRALYGFDVEEQAFKRLHAVSNSPSILKEEYVSKAFRYTSTTRSFREIPGHRALDAATDAVAIHPHVMRNFSRPKSHL